MSEFDFSSIEPYSGQEVPVAINRLARNPMFGKWVKAMNPQIDISSFASLLECVSTCDEFQYIIMRPLVYQIVKMSMTNFTYSGLEHLDKEKSYLFVSNHRDITLDAALLDVIFLGHLLKTPEVGFGNNLMKNDMIVDIFRLNKMFTIIRDGSRREFYNNSRFLSAYIHHALSEKKSSVWIAQRNGRTKDGNDRTDHGLLKMFSMAGTGDFEADFNAMRIVPVAMSYEYEPCDSAKAVETYVSMNGIYTKSHNEDMLSIMSGITQKKGAVHCTICEPIREEEVAECAKLEKNDRFTALAEVIDRRIHQGYKLHPTNYIAADLLRSRADYEDHYTTDEMEHFVDYVCRLSEQSPSLGAKTRFRDIFLTLYANPVINQLEG